MTGESAMRAVRARGHSFVVAGMGVVGYALLALVWVAGGPAVSIPMIALGVGALAPLVLMLTTALVAWLIWPAKIVVGAEGISTHWHRWRRFLSYAEIASLERHPRGLSVRMHDGTEQLVGCGRKTSDVLGAAAEQRLVEFRRHEHDRAIAAVGRNGRSASEWFAALDALANPTSAYRGVVVTREALWSVVENPAADATARAGAARVLRVHGDEADRHRLRRAAQSSARPKVRIALEAAAAEAVDPAELDSACDAVTVEAKQRL